MFSLSFWTGNVPVRGITRWECRSLVNGRGTHVDKGWTEFLFLLLPTIEGDRQSKRSRVGMTYDWISLSIEFSLTELNEADKFLLVIFVTHRKVNIKINNNNQLISLFLPLSPSTGHDNHQATATDGSIAMIIMMMMKQHREALYIPRRPRVLG